MADGNAVGDKVLAVLPNLRLGQDRPTQETVRVDRRGAGNAGASEVAAIVRHMRVREFHQPAQLPQLLLAQGLRIQPLRKFELEAEGQHGLACWWRQCRPSQPGDARVGDPRHFGHAVNP